MKTEIQENGKEQGKIIWRTIEVPLYLTDNVKV